MTAPHGTSHMADTAFLQHEAQTQMLCQLPEQATALPSPTQHNYWQQIS